MYRTFALCESMNALRTPNISIFWPTNPITLTIPVNRFWGSRINFSIYTRTSNSPSVIRLVGSRLEYNSGWLNFPYSTPTRVMADSKKGGRQITLGYVKDSQLTIRWVVVGLIPQ